MCLVASSHLTVQVFVLILPDRDLVQQDLPRLWFIKTLQQCYAGALPAAVQTHKCCDLTRVEVEGDVLHQEKKEEKKSH